MEIELNHHLPWRRQEMNSKTEKASNSSKRMIEEGK